MITVEILKAQLGGIQSKLNFDTVKPFVRSADRWFKSETGIDLYNYLKSLSNPAAGSNEAEMLDLAQACMSWYAYDLAFPHLKLRVGDQGMMKTVPQNQVAITKWEYVDSREANLAMVDMMLENFWTVVEDVRPSAWINSPAYGERHQHFIRSAAELGQYVSLVGRNSRFFQQLLPYINRAEDFYIKPLLTPALFSQIKYTWQHNDPIPAATKQLIDAIKPAVAHLAVFEAYPYLPLLVDQTGIRQGRQKDGLREEEFPESSLRNSQRRQLHQDGQSYLAIARMYLDSVASTTIFADYYNYQQANKRDDDDFTGKAHVLL